ncbi:MAG: DUF3078 domain-containing protein [Saprospiraceae bacterium]|nr:DUF3078 domain-containing protein [Saprospiraceae bacterium]
MRRILLSTLIVIIAYMAGAQSLDELKNKKAELEAQRAEQQAEADAFNGEISDLASQIEILSGWNRGFSGAIGFDFSKSTGWVANPNPDASSSSLNLNMTGFANRKGNDFFWNNKGIIAKSWQDVDLSKADGSVDDDGLFDNSTVDIVNLSSLYGKNLSDNFAISALGELNTSLENFFNPGTFDIGVGGTWLPAPNLVVVIHPLNYHVAFSGVDGVSSRGSIGTKLRADYTRSVDVGGKPLNWSSTLTSFIPYGGADEGQPTLFEYTWLNTFSYELYKGLGLGINFGIRNAEFESASTQSFYGLGLSYTL